MNKSEDNYESLRAVADKTTEKQVVHSEPEKKKRHKEGYTPYDISFPDDCPIEPVGVYGNTYYFLDNNRHLHAIAGDKINKGTIVPMLGDKQNYKYEQWPRFKPILKDGEIVGTDCTGWRPEQAADCLIAEANRRGIWDVRGKLRGPGCWKDDDGQTLVMHCGDVIYFGNAPMNPGKIGPYVYSSAPSLPHPDLEFDDQRFGLEVLELLKMWNWVRSELDPILMLGWIGAAIVGGALNWRPLVWITGDKATGKSTLQKFTRGIMGDDAVIASSDSTAAGIWQRVGHMTLPVALDEIEASTDNRKVQGIVNLARQAGSGDQMLRGGSDHNGASFTVRNCFMFSSILIPPLLGQDVSRMAILQLQELPKDSPSPPLNSDWLSAASKKIRGRLMAHWDRLDDLIDLWKERLAEVGHGGRGGDQFGTLLAVAWLLMSDKDPDEEEIARMCVALDKRSGSDEKSDHERCVVWLMSSMMDIYRSGERRTVSDWIRQAADMRDGTEGWSDIEVKEARRALENVGLKVSDKLIDGKRVWFLSVANEHQGLTGLFRDAHWIGQSGADGVWVQALRRVRDAKPDQQRFSGMRLSCTTIPFPSIFGEDADV
ncbi:MAG: hypothetical protein IAE63_06840 [Alphaproteobacteria bacterium]|nr:hypothetical protein [Alphaproteobacteria bacterium]